MGRAERILGGKEGEISFSHRAPYFTPMVETVRVKAIELLNTVTGQCV